jgi:hypothetical protein
MSLPRLKLLTFSLVLMLFLVPALHAAPAKIGPDHGKPGPTLPAVATPTMGSVKEEKMVDWSFPAHLAQTEDWPSAVSAYQQLAWQVSGTAKIEALRQVGFAQEQAGNHNAALQTYTNILSLPLVAQSPSRTLEFSAKATVAYLQRAPQTTPSLTFIATHIETVTRTPSPTNPWSAWALQALAWQQLKAGGNLPSTYGLPQLESLKKEVNNWKSEQKSIQHRTALLEAIPGLGLLFLNDKRAALGTFALWLFALTLAVTATVGRRYYAATVWWFVLAMVMLSTPSLAAQRARQLSADHWPGQLQKWQQQFPNERPKENPPQHISWIEDVPNSALAQQPDFSNILPAAGPDSFKKD